MKKRLNPARREYPSPILILIIKHPHIWEGRAKMRNWVSNLYFSSTNVRFCLIGGVIQNSHWFISIFASIISNGKFEEQLSLECIKHWHYSSLLRHGHHSVEVTAAIWWCRDIITPFLSFFLFLNLLKDTIPNPLHDSSPSFCRGLFAVRGEKRVFIRESKCPPPQSPGWRDRWPLIFNPLQKRGSLCLQRAIRRIWDFF